MTGRNKFKRYKKVIFFLVFIFKIFGKRGNYFLLKFFKNINGKAGIFLRYVFLKNCALEVGDNVSIHSQVYLFNLNRIKFGDNVSIHPMCYIDGVGGIDIGNDVSIAHATTIMSANHTWQDTNIPIKYNQEVTKQVIIENDVWIGAGVRILAGAVVHTRSIVAAGAVVNKSVNSGTIVGGVPAKVLKDIQI